MRQGHSRSHAEHAQRQMWMSVVPERRDLSASDARRCALATVLRRVREQAGSPPCRIVADRGYLARKWYRWAARGTTRNPLYSPAACWALRKVANDGGGGLGCIVVRMPLLHR